MPSGYTADIAKDISFEQFLWRCARGMGALIMMRDDPYDAPIPERFEPSQYHVKAIADAEARIAELKSMTAAQADAAADADFAEAFERHENTIREHNELRGKYMAMLSKVQDWEPPTSDHVGLKKLMSDQITESIEFDCSTKYYTDNPPRKATVGEWLGVALTKATRDLSYHTQENFKEIERTDARNRWLRELRKSVPPPVANATATPAGSDDAPPQS